MRNSISESAIILIAASSALFAQNNDFRVKPQNYPNLLDVHQLVESSIAATQRHWQARLHYSYVERDESRRLDLAGRVKSEERFWSIVFRSSNFWNATGSVPLPRRN
ncbi:MAG: hypothetical protein ABSB35_41145 [Bryobacteraceae bacterium]